MRRLNTGVGSGQNDTILSTLKLLNAISDFGGGRERATLLKVFNWSQKVCVDSAFCWKRLTASLSRYLVSSVCVERVNQSPTHLRDRISEPSTSSSCSRFWRQVRPRRSRLPSLRTIATPSGPSSADSTKTRILSCSGSLRSAGMASGKIKKSSGRSRLTASPKRLSIRYATCCSTSSPC